MEETRYSIVSKKQHMLKAESKESLPFDFYLLYHLLRYQLLDWLLPCWTPPSSLDDH